MNKVMNAGEVVRKLDSGMTIGIGAVSYTHLTLPTSDLG